MGKDHMTASREGTDEIGLAVAATTFSIVCVFVPIGFMSGFAGQWFKPFALTIACAVLVSLFVSFSLDPMLSAYWPDPHVPVEKKWALTKVLDRFNHWVNARAHDYRGVIAWALDHRAAMAALAIGTFFASFTVFSGGLTGLLVAFVGIALLVFALTHKSMLSVARVGIGLLGVAIFVVQFKYPALTARVIAPARTVGVGFFPDDDRSEFIVNLETPPG
jgi:HAE1 family hydrophobic/amphiphilic exporter-1